MKFLPLLLVLGFALLAISTALPPSQEVMREAEQAMFSPREIEIGLQRSWQSRLLFWGEQATHLGLLLLFVFTPLGRSLVDHLERTTGRRWLLTVLLTGLVFFLLDASLSLPWSVGRWLWNRSWGLSNQMFPDWLR